MKNCEQCGVEILDGESFGRFRLLAGYVHLHSRCLRPYITANAEAIVETLQAFLDGLPPDLASEARKALAQLMARIPRLNQ
jgi:hypothetical protein